VDEGTAVQDSTAIISYLDQKYLERPLTPHDRDEAKETLEWEEYLDEEIGITVRLLYYYHALPDRGLSTRALLRNAPWYGHPLYWLIFPQVRSAMEKGMRINANSARRSEIRLMDALQTLNKELERRPFLVGNRFSRADLTACSAAIATVSAG
jgi:glutathione S-transferase